jgi:hypothetical protein
MLAMTETIVVETSGDGLIVDKSRQYKPSAGQCAQCGHFKTWEFKITNPKTGKQIPGHVTKEGFKIGDGNCPYWNNISKMNTKKAEKKSTVQVRPAGTWINEIAGAAMAQQPVVKNPDPASTPDLPAEKKLSVLITIGTMNIMVTRNEALGIAKYILDQLVKQA